MDDSKSIVEILIKFGLLDAQNADTALQKLQLLDETQRTGMLGTLKAADAAKELGTAEEAGAGAAEHMHINHRALHQILHLIGHVAGPEAGAAVAGLSAVAAGGGIMSGVMAARLLMESFKQIKEEAEKAQEAIRQTFADTITNAQEAETAVKNTGVAIDDFWKNLDNKAAQERVKSAFAAQLQQFKDMAAVAEKLGLIGKDQGEKFTENRTVAAEEERAKALNESVKALTASLEAWKARITGDATKADMEETAKLKHDLAAVKDAYEKKERFFPESGVGKASGATLHAENDAIAYSTVYFGGIDDAGRAKRQKDFETISDAIAKEISARETNVKKQDEHTKLLESTIERMTTEAQQLGDSSGKTRNKQGTEDFSTGLTYANKGTSATPNEQMFLRAVEEQITGRNLTFDQAAALIKAQTANINTSIKILELHANEVYKIQQRLDYLEAHHGT